MVRERSQDAFASLSKSAARLATSSDKLSKELREAVKALEDLHLGMDIEDDSWLLDVPTDLPRDGDRPYPDRPHRINYVLHLGADGLVSVREYEIEFDAERTLEVCDQALLSATPLLSSNRQIRIAAGERWPGFLDCVNQVVSERADTVEATLASKK